MQRKTRHSLVQNLLELALREAELDGALEVELLALEDVDEDLLLLDNALERVALAVLLLQLGLDLLLARVDDLLHRGLAVERLLQLLLVGLHLVDEPSDLLLFGGRGRDPVPGHPLDLVVLRLQVHDRRLHRRELRVQRVHLLLELRRPRLALLKLLLELVPLLNSDLQLRLLVRLIGDLFLEVPRLLLDYLLEFLVPPPQVLHLCVHAHVLQHFRVHLALLCQLGRHLADSVLVLLLLFREFRLLSRGFICLLRLRPAVRNRLIRDGNRDHVLRLLEDLRGAVLLLRDYLVSPRDVLFELVQVVFQIGHWNLEWYLHSRILLLREHFITPMGVAPS